MTKYIDPGVIELDAQIQRDSEVSNSSAWITIPFDLKETFGVGNLIPVKVVFDKHVEYQGSLAKMGGPHAMLILRKDIRAKLGKQPGEIVHVEIRLDKEKRSVQLDSDVKTALKNTGLEVIFDKLAFSHQREYIQWIDEAKKPETRSNRIQKMCEMLQIKQQ